MAGVAWSNNKIYVLCEKPKRVRVFRDMNLFEELEEEGFDLADIGDQLDLAVSSNSSNQCIIISDWERECFWKFMAPDKNPIRQDIDGQPGKMWIISSDEMLVVVKR